MKVQMANSVEISEYPRFKKGFEYTVSKTIGKILIERGHAVESKMVEKVEEPKQKTNKSVKK